MGISSALYSGVSGLTTNATAMSVIGNNLANTNTLGFKTSRSVFSDLLSGTVTGSGGTSQVGRGVNMSTVDQVFSQGTFDSTESNLDVAIEGDGFFIVSPASEETNYYTRAGSFRFDGDGYLVNPEGYRVQGKLFDDDSEMLPGDATDIQVVNRGLVGGKISDEITMNTNLDSRAEVKVPAGADPEDVFDASDSSTYNAASSVEIYDSLGVGHVVTVYFMRTGQGTDTEESTWAAFWTANDVDGTPLPVQTDAAGDAVLYDPDNVPVSYNAAGEAVDASGTVVDPVTYDATGTLVDSTGAAVVDADGRPKVPVKFTAESALNDDGTVKGTMLEAGVYGSGVAATGGATITNLTFDKNGTLTDPLESTTAQEDTFLTLPGDLLKWGNGSAVEDVEIIFDTTQYSSDSVVLSVDQNGYGAGSMTGTAINEEGILIATYSNGKEQYIGQLALAKFANPNGLELEGSNIYGATDLSGAPRVGIPDDELGTVFTYSLEQSNVDMGSEFVQMISIQRGYQANSKIITTVDEMMEEVINLKR
jgi:flagellar hook protein FlgE